MISVFGFTSTGFGIVPFGRGAFVSIKALTGSQIHLPVIFESSTALSKLVIIFDS